MTTQRQKYPGIEVPNTDKPDMAAFVQAVKERIEQFTGDRGDPKGRFVTLRDLELAGIVKVQVKNKYGVMSAADSSAVDSTQNITESTDAVLTVYLNSQQIPWYAVKPTHEVLLLDPEERLLQRVSIEAMFDGVAHTTEYERVEELWEFFSGLGLSSNLLLGGDAEGEIPGDPGADGDFLISKGPGVAPEWLPLDMLFADPSASIGLTPVPGTATTAMRSDAAPQLDQAIAPTWTGVHTHQRLSLAQSAAAPVLVNGDTITTASVGEARVAPAGAVTGIIMQAGTSPGQVVVVVNQSAFLVTMAASGTSNVADGVSCTIAPLTSKTFVWNSAESRWFAAGGGGSGGASPLTTKGDLYTYSTLDTRLPVGTDGYHLIADAAETTGLKWVPNNSDSAPEVRGASFSAGVSTIIVPTNNVPINIREDCYIHSVVVLTQGGPGSCVLDIWKSSYGAYPPTVANTICAAAKPTISADDTYQDSTLTGWTTTLSAGDTLLVNLESCSTFTAVTIFLVLMPVGVTPVSGYDDERARDAIGAALTDTATVQFTYDDAANTIEADVDTTALDVFTSTLPGIVPASGGLSTEYLSADGTFSVPAGSGAPASEGSYTPTVSGTTNVSASTAGVARYIRVGSTVWVAGTIQIDPTASGQTAFSLSLPVASNFTATPFCAGGLNMNNATTTFSGTVSPDAANPGNAVCSAVVSDLANRTWYYTYSYEVLP